VTPDQLVSEITVSIRRSLFQRLKTLPISQSELTGLIATATRAVITKGQVGDLAVMAAEGANLAGVVEAADPDDPALFTWKSRRSGMDPKIRDLTELP